jgi:hypothetical protein
VIADSSNTLVHLAPARVVARVATGTGPFRPGGDWLAREVAVCSHLAAHGAPAVAPARELPPGPHERDGLWLSFLELLDAAPAPVDPPVAGAALREVHDALASFDGELPLMLALDDVERMVPTLLERQLVDREEALLLERCARRVSERVAALELPVQALHGDSHLGNAIDTSDGGVAWIDFEDAFAGPVEWDLACLVAPGRHGAHDPEPCEAALAAYGRDVDPATLDLLVDARGVQLAAWTIGLAPEIPRIRPAVARWLDWLNDLDGG